MAAPPHTTLKKTSKVSRSPGSLVFRTFSGFPLICHNFSCVFSLIVYTSHNLDCVVTSSRCVPRSINHVTETSPGKWCAKCESALWVMSRRAASSCTALESSQASCVARPVVVADVPAAAALPLLPPQPQPLYDDDEP